MGSKNLGSGDFQFPPSFGFSGSATGNVNPQRHPTMSQDEFGDDSALNAAGDAEPAMRRGGPVIPRAKSSIPAPKAAKAVLGALQVGKMIGQRSAAPGAGMPPMAPPVTQGPVPSPMAAPGMRKGGRTRHTAQGGDAQFDSDANRAEAEAHEQTVPGEMDSANPAQSDAEILKAHGYAEGGKFIQGAIKHPGALHSDLGVPQGQKIPAGKLAAAAKKSGKIGQRARFAETLRGLNHSKKG